MGENMADDKIKLTLNEEIEEDEEIEEVEKVVEAQPLTEKSVQFEEGALTEEEKKMVDEFSKQIDITSSTTILQYGSAAQQKIAAFSDIALEKVQTKDLGATGVLMTDLVGELRNFDIEEDDNVIVKFFKKQTNSIKNIRTKYEDVNVNVEKIVNELEQHQIVLLKDIALLDQLYEKNLVNYKELTMYILAGQKRLKEIKQKDLPKSQLKAKQSGLPEDAQAANDLANAVNRFEKKLHDLELTRVVSIQMAPQIRMVQNNDTIMTEKIQSTLVNTIPLWKSQMLIALGVNHSKEAMQAQREVTNLTNELLRSNAEKLKQGTVEVAKASERGIVDIETLSNTNKKLIETLEEVAKIQEEGRKKRAEAQVELRRIEKELNNKLTEVKEEAKSVDTQKS
jgi:uncharacterized protein YaaN involved in tellurite resistance